MRRPAKKDQVKPSATKMDVIRLTSMLANHAARATRAAGRIKSCACDLCRAATNRLQRLRDAANR